MARMLLEIPSETLCQLMQLATLERRPTRQQAEVILIRAVSELYSPVLHSESFDHEVMSEGKREPSALTR
jgi:hypothetical protein